LNVNVLNRLPSIPDSTPAYDKRGNLASLVLAGMRIWTYTYDHENRLTCVQTDTYYTPESYRFKVEFVYDGQGRMRIKRNYIWSGDGWYGSGGEARYLYDGMLSVQERDAGNVPTVTYTRGRDLSGTIEGAGGIGGLLARSHGYGSGSWTYHNFYHSDGNGNVTALVNSGGTLQASYTYDPYGRYLSSTGTLLTSNVMRFSSKPWIGFQGAATSGLYYYGYRFYDPYLQRWILRDPLEEAGGNNLYCFVSNNPLTGSDGYGEVTIIEIGVLVVTGVCIATILIDLYERATEPFEFPGKLRHPHEHEPDPDPVQPPEPSLCPIRAPPFADPCDPHRHHRPPRPPLRPARGRFSAAEVYGADHSLSSLCREFQSDQLNVCQTEALEGRFQV